MKTRLLLLLLGLLALSAQAQTLTIAPFGATPTSGCVALPLIATAQGFSPSSFTWSCSPQGPLSSTNTQNTTFQSPPVTQPTTFTVTLRASGFTFGSPIFVEQTTQLVLTVLPQPGFTVQPASASVVCAGGSVSTAINLTALSPVSVQWLRNGVAVSGQAGATLSLTGVSAAQSGTYVAVASGCISVTSSPFVLSVGSIPNFGVSSPAALCAGSVVSLTATGCGGGLVRWPGGVTGAVLSTGVAGTYTATCTAAGSCGVSATAQGVVLPPPTRLYVSAGQTATVGDGLSWATAFRDLQQALTYPCLQSVTEIWVARGTYKPTGTTDRTVSFAMLPGVAIYGGFVGTETALSQRPPVNPNAGTPSSSTLSGEIGNPGSTTDNSLHVINNPRGLTNTAVLDGFVVTGGNANGNAFYPDSLGGGVYNRGFNSGAVCSPTFRNCMFAGNSALYGGVMLNDGGSNGTSSPSLINCSFADNSAAFLGGAMYNFATSSGTSSPSVVNCSFQSNTAVSGGAIHNLASSNGISSPILVNCSFVGNSTSDPRSIGGAIVNVVQGTGTSSLSLVNCSFLNNTAAAGGAMVNSVWRDNSENQGTSRPFLSNCVLWGNGGSGAIINILNGNSGASASASPTVRSSLFEPNLFGIPSDPSNLITTTSPFASTTSVVLNACSPAINAGNLSAYTAVGGPDRDLLGNPRVANGRIDMGAVEFTGIGMVTVQSGPWTDPATWSCGRVPVAAEPVGIRHAVTLPTGVAGQAGRLSYGPGGRLLYQTGTRLQLTGQ